MSLLYCFAPDLTKELGDLNSYLIFLIKFFGSNSREKENFITLVQGSP